jgi:hypothetical protein
MPFGISFGGTQAPGLSFPCLLLGSADLTGSIKTSRSFFLAHTTPATVASVVAATVGSGMLTRVHVGSPRLNASGAAL